LTGGEKIRKNAILFIFTIAFALVMCGAVSATSYTDIYVSPTGNDSYDGGDSSHPAQTIQHALEVTKDNGSTIHLANGTYSGKNNTNITLNKNMTIKGESQTGTIITGTDTNWIFYIPDGINVTIINIMLTHGNASTACGNNGGTIYNDGKLTVKNCAFTSNTANNAAGAIFNSNTGTLTVTGSTFTGNNATNYGGAVYNYGNSTITSSNFTDNTANGTSGRGGAIFNIGGTLTITNSNFMYNTAKGSSGGAIDNSGALTIISCSFTGNIATDTWGRGGAIYNTGKLNVADSNFTGNNATMFAGAIWNDGGNSTAPAIISKSNFKDNNASSDSGGAIYNYSTRNLIITGSAFSGNNAPSGGAIYNCGILTVTGNNFISNKANNYGGAICNQATLNITDSNFTGNTVTSYGGAISNIGSLIVFHSNFTGNTATGYGGAIYNDLINTLTVTGSSFKGNNAVGGSAVYSTNGAANINFNQIVENTGNGIIYLKIGTGTLNADNNWWGDNNNPSGKISGFTVSKWLVLTMTAPSSAQVNSNSVITADLRYDNSGTLHTEAYLPNGIPVSFTTSLGTINSQSTTVNGIAKAILKSGLLGIASVTASLDNQTLDRSVKIVDTIPPKVTSTYPKKNAKKVSKTKTIVIKFSEKAPNGLKSILKTSTAIRLKSANQSQETTYTSKPKREPVIHIIQCTFQFQL